MAFNLDLRLESRVAGRHGHKLACEESSDWVSSADNVKLPGNTDPIQFVTLKKITARLLESPQQIDKYGLPVCIGSCAKYLALGTARGHIFVFDYQQDLEAVISPGHSVTALAFSLDSESLASGHSNGQVHVYTLANHQSPVFSFDSQDSPISSVSFVGKRHSALLSLTDDGNLVYHQASRVFLGFATKSRTLVSNILSTAQLPIGPLPYPTDTMDVMAVMNSSGITVLSTNSAVQDHFRVGRPKMASSTATTGCIAWYPATETAGPVLAYSWANVLTLVDVVADGITNEHHAESILLRYENKRRHLCQEHIVAVHWLNSKVLIVLTASQRLICFSRETLSILNEQDVMSKHIKYRKLEHARRDFAAAATVYRSKLFVLGKYQVFFGAPRNWADELFGLLQSGQYIQALETACAQYEGNCDLILIGLPEDADERHRQMKQHILEILDVSSSYIFTDQTVLALDQAKRNDTLALFLNTAFKVCASLKTDPLIYDQLYDKYSSQGLEGVFFNVLERFIFREEIVILPPAVLRKMVARYISDERGEVLEDLICLLDLTQLDLDLTITLCREHHLNDCLVFIWNTMMEDYISPMFDAIRAIKTNSSAQYYEYIYPYISYTLTGRQYPTEKPIYYKQLETAKKNLYYVLFNGAAVSWPKGSAKLHIVSDDQVDDEPAFPYLVLLLKQDGARFFRVMNEIFEDIYLNDDEVFGFSSNFDTYELKVNRQYVVDVLMGIFGENEFSQLEKTYLSIFIARNYPKYLQFIRLSNSTLEKVIRDLCAYPNDELKDECELSLQSLLSVYRPNNSIVPLLESVGFYNALVSIYNSEHRALKLLELWCEQDSRTDAADIVERCFRLVGSNPGEKHDIEQFLAAHFAEFCVEPCSIAVTFSRHCPELNSHVLELEDSRKKYEYLRTLFELRTQEEVATTPAMELEYAECLFEFDHDKLKPFVLESTVDEKMMRFLQQNGEIETIVEIHRQRGQIEDAVDVVVQGLVSTAQRLQPGDNSQDLWKYLHLGFKVIKETDPTRSTELQQDEKLYLRLLETSVSFFVTEEGPLLDIYKRLVQDAFTSLINIKRDYSESFFRIFNTFLSRSSAKLTTLEEVRPVLSEIFQAYSHEKLIYEIVLKLVNHDIFQELHVLDAKRAGGWSLANLECEVCGKPIWGPKIGSQIYDVWQTYKISGTVPTSPELQIVVFQCRHGYHTKCLNNLGVNNECILCRDH
ncbi:hypothetical protein OGAPHI_005785 [Ogataea philodendri]|uniref:RING-type domain-containing protein n=1 Tax=Ogataea philodendri TaxID=1378263 RepID=A0A9P8NZ17_9ASCO|nr:uncharacterized protein OGAPHI_005785 [Ogataea philodendri]KAH3662533.1 hypothetical protein OGAPHI_005785 [Ogataea philodendri]